MAHKKTYVFAAGSPWNTMNFPFFRLGLASRMGVAQLVNGKPSDVIKKKVNYAITYHLHLLTGHIQKKNL